MEALRPTTGITVMAQLGQGQPHYIPIPNQVSTK